MRFIDIKMGTVGTISCLLVSVEEKTSKAGQPFCNLVLTDGAQQINAIIFDMTAERLGVIPPAVVTVTLALTDFNGASWNAKTIKPCEEDVPIEMFIIKAPIDSEEMYDRILSGLKRYPGQLADIAAAIYEDNKESLICWSGGTFIHHNYYGGLLYHVYRMMAAAMRMIQVYGNLDAELLISGIVLHDIGKLKELNTTELGISEYTIDGNLFGHLLLGVETINDKVRELEEDGVNLDKERIRLLKHCIASHHEKLEYGAIRMPAIPEAYVISVLDMLDARMDIFRKELDKVNIGEMAGGRCNSLGGVTVYRSAYAETEPEEDDSVADAEPDDGES